MLKPVTASKCLTTGSLEEKKTLCFVAFANFCLVISPTKTDFKLPTNIIPLSRVRKRCTQDPLASQRKPAFRTALVKAKI